jgi:CRP-like cAMP-binding protein
MLREGDEPGYCTLLLSGFMGRVKDLRDGGRQINALHLPGDFLDLHSLPLKRLDHDIISITASKILIAPHDRLRRVTERLPHLTRLLWLVSALDSAVHREWALSLGRRAAIARVAHLLCELQLRLQVVGMAEGDSYDLPLTQTEMSECLGLTPVHVNRTLRALRELKLADVHNKRVTLHDQPGLARIAEFDPSYLLLDRQPR